MVPYPISDAVFIEVIAVTILLPTYLAQKPVSAQKYYDISVECIAFAWSKEERERMKAWDLLHAEV